MVRNRPPRILIVGNCGSGKSWLAARLARPLGLEPVGMDALRWEPGGRGIARATAEATALVRQAAEADSFVIEGVYGWLAAEALPRATRLVWLDLPLAECLANIAARGPQNGEDSAAFERLLAWAAQYEERGTSSSRAGHAGLLAGFGRTAVRLCSRVEVAVHADSSMGILTHTGS